MPSRNYRGAQWPLADYQTDAYDLSSAFHGHAALQGSLRDEFDKAAAAIKADPDLSASGRQNKLVALAEQYRSHKVVTAMQSSLADLKKREAALREKLTTRPTVNYDQLSPHAAGRLLDTERRTVDRFERATSEQQREMVRSALERSDHTLLSTLLRENLLDPAIARRVQVELMRQGDADGFRELQMLSGKLGFDGEADPLTSPIAVGGQALALFHEFLDEAAGIPPGERDAKAAVDAADKDGAVTITPLQGKNPQIFRIAAARAAAKGVELRIRGDEGEGAISPGEFAPLTVDGNGLGK
jgi:hypothetical protein